MVHGEDKKVVALRRVANSAGVFHVNDLTKKIIKDHLPGVSSDLNLVDVDSAVTTLTHCVNNSKYAINNKDNILEGTGWNKNGELYDAVRKTLTAGLITQAEANQAFNNIESFCP